MLKRMLSCVLLTPLTVLALVVSSAACGTIMNFTGGGQHATENPVPYGGVRADLLTPNWKNAANWDATAVILVTPVFIADVAISAVLDTVTLPLVIWVNLERAMEREKARANPDAVPTAMPTSPTLPIEGVPMKEVVPN